MNKQRLKVLSKHLRENVSTLDMSRWADECGTASCAMGHACTIPEFKAAGLHLMEGYGVTIFPAFDGAHSYYAAQRFFNLSREDALHLFDPYCYVQMFPDIFKSGLHPAAVADRIDALIARG